MIKFLNQEIIFFHMKKSRAFSTVRFLRELLEYSGVISPYDFWKILTEEKNRKTSYNSVCRLFCILEKCGLIKQSKIDKEIVNGFGRKLAKKYYEAVPLDEYEVPDFILNDEYFKGKSKEEIYKMLWSNPQLIFPSYRERHSEKYKKKL